MIGSIIGDIVGSIYEFDNIKTKEFDFFNPHKDFTDDSILTLATADWIMNKGNVADYYIRYALDNPSPKGGYGGLFSRWIIDSDRFHTPMKPYNSCGNGSAMRVGPVGSACRTEDEVLDMAQKSSECTHNHPEGIKGAQATALAIFMAKEGKTSEEIKNCIEDKFKYDLSMTVEELQKRYSWGGLDGNGNGGICQDSVPQAIICALKAESFEDAVRNAISIGGDSDTIGCITGSIAEFLYGIPKKIYQEGLSYLPEKYKSIVEKFENRYGGRII